MNRHSTTMILQYCCCIFYVWCGPSNHSSSLSQQAKKADWTEHTRPARSPTKAKGIWPACIPTCLLLIPMAQPKILTTHRPLQPRWTIFPSKNHWLIIFRPQKPPIPVKNHLLLLYYRYYCLLLYYGYFPCDFIFIFIFAETKKREACNLREGNFHAPAFAVTHTHKHTQTHLPSNAHAGTSDSCPVKTGLLVTNSLRVQTPA